MSSWTYRISVGKFNSATLDLTFGAQGNIAQDQYTDGQVSHEDADAAVAIFVDALNDAISNYWPNYDGTSGTGSVDTGSIQRIDTTEV